MELIELLASERCVSGLGLEINEKGWLSCSLAIDVR